MSKTSCYVFGPPTTTNSVITNVYSNFADGGVVSIPWSGDTLPLKGGWETSNGSASNGYSYTNFDALINAQLSFGAKSIVIVLEPISFPNSNTFTPNYVFTTGWATANSTTQLYTAAGTDFTGSGAIAAGSSAQGVDNTAFPAAWMPAFTIAWKAAVANAIAHIKGSLYASQVAYIRVGYGSGGEAFPHGTAGLLTVPGGPTTIAQLQTTWVSTYIAAIQSQIVTSAPGVPVVGALDGGFQFQNIPYSYGTAEAALAVSNGFAIGAETLQSSDITAFTSEGIADGGAATSGFPSTNHAYLFNLYRNSVPFLEFQTGAASTPGGGNASLPNLLAYGLARGATRFELYYQDWQVAYDTSNGNNAAFGAAYAAALQQARTGTVGLLPTPTPVVLTNVNGLLLTISGSTNGNQLGSPTPVVLCDQNGDVYSVVDLVVSNGSNSLTITGTPLATRTGSPTPIVLCDPNGNPLNLGVSVTSGTPKLGQPIPVCLTDRNGNAYTVSGATSITGAPQAPLPCVLTTASGIALIP